MTQDTIQDGHIKENDENNHSGQIEVVDLEEPEELRSPGTITIGNERLTIEKILGHELEKKPVIRDMRSQQKEKKEEEKEEEKKEEEPHIPEYSFRSCLIERAEHYRDVYQHVILRGYPTIGNPVDKLYELFTDDLAKVESDKKAKKIFQNFLTQLAVYYADHSGRKLTPEKAFKEIQALANLKLIEDGTSPVVTVSTDVSKKWTYLQFEEPICALTKEQVTEYLKIFYDNHKKQPKWFRALSKVEQTELKQFLKDKLGENIGSKTVVDANFIAKFNDVFHTIPSSYRGVPGLANYYRHTFVSCDDKGNETARSTRYRYGVPVPIEIEKKISGRVTDQVKKGIPGLKRERLRITEMNLRQLIETELRDSALRYLELYGVTDTPPVFTLPINIQTLLSSLRLDPLHFSSNTMMVKMLQEAIKNVQKGELFQSGIQVTDKKDNVYTVKPKMIFGNQPVYGRGKIRDSLIALVGPFVDKLKRANRKNAMKLNAQVCGSFELMEKWLRKNKIDPVNAGGYCSLEQLREKLETIKKFPIDEKVYREIAKVTSKEGKFSILTCSASYKKQLVRQNQHEIPQLQNLLVSLNALDRFLFMHSKHKVKIRSDYPLYMNALNLILTDTIGGGAGGSCKSGKDRKGMAELFADTMLAYYAQKGEFPAYDDLPNNQNFIDIFVDLFYTNHHQYMASLNAPGSKGIKSLKRILPGYLIKALEKRNLDVLKQNQKSASLNKPKISSDINKAKSAVKSVGGLRPKQKRIKRATPLGGSTEHITRMMPLHKKPISELTPAELRKKRKATVFWGVLLSFTVVAPLYCVRAFRRYTSELERRMKKEPLLKSLDDERDKKSRFSRHRKKEKKEETKRPVYTGL